MLVLARGKNESIIITTQEGQIEITILGFLSSYRTVRLGIDAPRNIEVHRKEIHLQNERAKEAKNGTIIDLSSQTH